MMSRNSILTDTSFWVALGDVKDKYREQALQFARSNRQQRVVPDVVLTEVTHLLNRHVSFHAVLVFLKAFSASDVQLESVTMQDVRRAAEIMEQYADAKLDFVDCCIMALAERLEIYQICTFDRRDFVIFRRPDGEALELLP
jgi:predicted nucleic acid-binding protein